MNKNNYFIIHYIIDYNTLKYTFSFAILILIFTIIITYFNILTFIFTIEVIHRRHPRFRCGLPG